MGQTVAASFQTPTLFLIATDLTKMEVDTNVSESDIGGLREGHRAIFTVDAYPKRSFEGTVSQIRQSPQTVQNVVTFDIIVTVANRDLALKPGLTASTRIIVDRRGDVMRVPNTALRYRPSNLAESTLPDRLKVWLLRDGQPTPVSIVVGLDDDGFTEIVSGGLKVDEQVNTGEQSMSRTTIMPRLR
jgi:HlyD family secretion protein